jgi:hypothetical protein
MSAFVPAAAASVGVSVSSFHPSFTRSPSSAAAPPCFAIRRITRAALRPDTETEKVPRFNSIAENRAAMSDSIVQQPKGFTPYAEKVNGRLAQLGFVIGLATEILSHDHLTIGQQILLMFSPVTNLFGL